MEKETQNREEKLPRRVYCVQSANDSTVLYALDVTFGPEYIRWFDGTKERIMRTDSPGETGADGNFSFVRSTEEGGATYTFAPMTLEIYLQQVMPRLVAGKNFADEEAMLKAFESTRETAW